jgi:2'-5' RNA ligase
MKPENKQNILDEKIGYVDVIFSHESNMLLNQIIKDLGLKKDFKDNFHCTIAYSKKDFNFKLPGEKLGNVKIRDLKAISTISETCTIKDFGNFKTDDGLNLHVVLDCKYCKSEFKRCIKAGAIYDYDKYVPHITLLYNCTLPGEDKAIPKKYFKNTLNKYIGKKLTIVRERKQKLNKNWVEESKK